MLLGIIALRDIIKDRACFMTKEFLIFRASKNLHISNTCVTQSLRAVNESKTR